MLRADKAPGRKIRYNAKPAGGNAAASPEPLVRPHSGIPHATLLSEESDSCPNRYTHHIDYHANLLHLHSQRQKIPVCISPLLRHFCTPGLVRPHATLYVPPHTGAAGMGTVLYLPFLKAKIVGAHIARLSCFTLHAEGPHDALLEGFVS